MSLRYVVPTLGLVAVTAAPAMAADVGGLNVAGYVDTILELSTADEAAAGNPDDDTRADFSAAAQLEIGYQIGDAVSANMELYFDEDGFGAGDLEQAYVSWAVSEQVSLVMGRFHNWIGWEGQDAPELYRVNNSYMYAGGTWAGAGWTWWGDDVTGIGAIITPSDELELGVFIVDYIWLEPAARTSDSLSFGAYATYTVDGIGYVDLDIGFGADEWNGDADIFQVDVNGEIDTLREDNGLLFAFDINFTDWDAATSMGILALANYVLPTTTPMSLTGSINYYEPNDDADDDEAIELAIALLTNPTDDENFGLNAEFRYISRSADDANELGLFLEALAIIP